MKLRSTPEAPAPADRSAIRTEDLTVVLGATPVLRGVDLAVAEGEAVALMGGNGSGKSTLIKSLLGIVPVDSGEARLFGADVTGARRAVPWSRIGYVPQRVGVGAGVPATALEVVASGLTGHRRLRPGPGPGARASTPWSRWDWPTGRARAWRSSPAASSSGC